MMRPMTVSRGRTALLVACLTAALCSACSAESSVSTATGATQVYPSAQPLRSGEVRATGPEQAPSEPGQQVVLLHCGVQNIMYEGVQWEVENPAFDAGTPPEPTFSGLGTFDRDEAVLTFTDREGAVVRFTRWDGTPNPGTCF